MWNNLFDNIFLITLANADGRKRFLSACQQMVKYSIPFETVIGNEDSCGARGLFRTISGLFKECLKRGYKRVMILEDDFLWVEDPAYYLPWIMEQLEEQRGWKMLNLGPNTHVQLERVSPNLLEGKKCRSTHAMIYSAEGMENALSYMPTYWMPIDELFEEKIDKYFVSYPLLATQKDGYSHIENKEVVMDYIVHRFKQNTSHLA